MPNILLVDDEKILAETISYNLQQAGYTVHVVNDGLAALKAVRENRPDLILLDLMLPEIDGLEVCRRLRQDRATATIPILMLTARGEEIDKVVGLEVGADDYVTKPFARRELLARIRALLRRAGSPPDEQHEQAGNKNGIGIKGSTPTRFLDAGPIRIDLAGRLVVCRGQEIELQPKQFDLLAYFVHNRGTVLTRAQLLHHVWGYSYAGDTRTVDVHIRWLREKVEEDPTHPTLLQTVRGVGYVLRL